MDCGMDCVMRDEEEERDGPARSPSLEDITDGHPKSQMEDAAGSIRLGLQPHHSNSGIVLVGV